MTDPGELDTDEIEIRSAAKLLPVSWSASLDDYALDLRWSPDDC